jgi:hypothetical protein
MSRNWLAVASADHVTLGRRGGFMQVCHGRPEPLGRLLPGDRVVYYSPTHRYWPSHSERVRDRLQAFTALGTVAHGKPYQVDTGAGLNPWRRDVAWHEAETVALALLMAELDFTRGPNWGYRLRRGLVEIVASDMERIAEAMFTAAARPCRRAA